MSVINRGNNHWELRVYMGQDSEGNKIRKTKRVTVTSKRAAERELENFKFELRNQADKRQADKITFAEFAKIWDTRHNATLALTTRENQRQLLGNRILDTFSGMLLKNITIHDIRQFLQKLRTPGENSNPNAEDGKLSETMVYKNLKLVRQILNKAVEWKFLTHNPCDDLEDREIPKPDYEHYPILQENPLQKFLQVVDALPNTPTELKHKVMLYLALITGLRKGELSALTWHDVDLKEQRIYVHQSQKYVTAKLTEISKPKTEKSVRFVYIDDYLVRLLQTYKTQQEAYLRRKGYVNPHQYILLAIRLRNGELVPVSPSYLNAWLTKLCAKNDIPHITVHSLRHMAATYALNEGAALTTVQSMLGHTNIRTTSIYLHPLDSKKKETAEIMSNKFKELRNLK